MEMEIPRKRVSKGKKISLWVIAILVVILIIGSLGAVYFVKRPLPQMEGELELLGLHNEVEVLRDQEGVPHIKADDTQDLFFAQGYVQAQDRMFQMDLSRRQASGRLSEVIGEAMLKNDKYFRTLGLRRAAEDSYESYSPEAREILQSFAEGVNAYIKEKKAKGKWPIEFTFLGYEPEEWTPIDSLTIGKYMAFDLGGNWNSQAFRHYLLQSFPKEKAYELFPSYPAGAPVNITKDELDIEGSLSSSVVPNEYNGSNNWVVSGEKTQSGEPLLANDPHLSLATPSVWYQNHLEGPGYNVSGVIFAGIPGIILGHNLTIAWGVTNVGPDVQDLYIEKRNPEQEDEFLYKKEWEKAQVIHEKIKIKGQKSEDFKITITRHGPVISEFLGSVGKEHVLALKWTALQPSNELEAVLNMGKSKDWTEFEKALEDFESPAQNFVFASKEGTIAYKANGKIPIRKDKQDALLPVEGWTGENEWVGYIPYNELPRTINAEKGYISTANNKVTDEHYPYHISHDWAQPYRQMRIDEVLSGNDKLTIEEMKNLQMDQRNLQAEEFLPKFIEELSETKETEAIDVLEDWNYMDDKEMAAPLLFQLWMAEISDTLFADDISEEMLTLFRGRKQAVDQLLRKALNGEKSIWIEDKGGLKTVLETSLKKAVTKGKEIQGGVLSNWRWGDYHQIQFKHPLSSVSPLQYVFNYKGELESGGSAVTVQAAGYDTKGTINHGGSWRFIADLSDLSKASHIVGPGQSGQLGSEWYQNQMEDWVTGTYHLTKLNEKNGVKLRLIPKIKR
ncbi:penicillin acylase family protein [Pradoshia sp. D12]|uniref:penicillin acylase family protein n=1 Tax=Bacillaceae TaxID=186817 RepID=UPI001120ADB9|nr:MULTISPECIES: penicillin acylase family protein [Bacillaceae]QFK69991.1 penicillin acylase family protein [Pradoshia sp. D12]TPF70511.1 penicillin acylase family protein [Bacillus sp. D12]